MVSGQNLEFNLKSTFIVDSATDSEWRNPLDIIQEDIITWVLEKFGMEVIVQAKEQYFTESGMIFHDDDCYHQRMKYFLDFFLFARVLSDKTEHPPTPFALYKRTHPECPIQNYTHSLFKVSRISKRGLVLTDLCSNDIISIEKQFNQLFDGMQKSDVFQGFVFHVNNAPVLSHGLIFHPARSHRILVKQLKEARKHHELDRLKYLARSARLQLKHDRLKHVDPRLVYAGDRS